jgi:hypothetical protein
MIDHKRKVLPTHPEIKLIFFMKNFHEEAIEHRREGPLNSS